MSVLKAAAVQRIMLWGVCLLIFAVFVAGFLEYQYPSSASCRAMIQRYGDLPLTGNSKTPSLALYYFEFRLGPCYREVRANLAAMEARQKEESLRHDAEKAEAARRKAILENRQAIFPNQAAWVEAEAASERELARLQQAEPCRSKLDLEAKGRANFLQMTVQEQQSLSKLILENSDNCR